MGTAKVNETDSREETCAAQACRLQRKKTRVPRTGPNYRLQMLQEFQGAINGSYLRKSWDKAGTGDGDTQHLKVMQDMGMQLTAMERHSE